MSHLFHIMLRFYTVSRAKNFCLIFGRRRWFRSNIRNSSFIRCEYYASFLLLHIYYCVGPIFEVSYVPPRYNILVYKIVFFCFYNFIWRRSGCKFYIFFSIVDLLKFLEIEEVSSEFNSLPSLVNGAQISEKGKETEEELESDFPQKGMTLWLWSIWKSYVFQ